MRARVCIGFSERKRELTLNCFLDLARIRVISLIGSFLSLVRFVTSLNELIGKNVIGAKAYMLGEVNGAEVDTEKWQVTHLHVSLTGEATRELGFKKPLMGSLTVYVPVSLVQAAGDIITLNKGVRELKDVIKPEKG